MNDKDIVVHAFQAKISDLPMITAISNINSGDGMWSQWVKDVIAMSNGLCTILFCRVGYYPYMLNKWEKDIAQYLPEIQAGLDAQAKRNKEHQEWEERMNKERNPNV